MIGYEYTAVLQGKRSKELADKYLKTKDMEINFKMYLTKDNYGWVRLWTIKPRKGNNEWHAEYQSEDSYYSIVIDADTFNIPEDLSWDNDEPIEVVVKRS